MAEIATVVAGLSSSEAAVRLARDGANVLPARRSVPLWHRVAIFPPFDTGKREVPYRTILELFESYGKIP